MRTGYRNPRLKRVAMTTKLAVVVVAMERLELAAAVEFRISASANNHRPTSTRRR